MKHFYITLALFFSFSFMSAQIVDIPDANFKNALLNYDPLIDTNSDGEIQVSEASVFNGILDLSSKNINTVDGIQAFVNVVELNLRYNSLTELNLNNLVALEILKLDHNDIVSIEFSQNPNLKEFWANFNEFITLDFSNLQFLEFVQVSYVNDLFSVNVDGCINLEKLFLGNTDLQALDVSSNPILELIQIIDTPVSDLDVSQNPLINRLLLNGSQIENIDVSNNPDLQYLTLNETPITTIDFSQNPNMFSFRASDCPNLQFINARNGQNNAISQFLAENSPNLDYICVDNISYATINFDLSDNTVLTEDCVNPNGDYNIIRGRLSFDFNADGCTPDDFPVSNNMIYSTNGADTYASFANENGEYAIVVDTGVYTTGAIEYLSLFESTPTNSTQEFTDYGNTAFQNFCFTANEDVSNVWTYMCLLQDSRPGYETSYIINVSNSGSILSSGTIEFQFDEDKQSFVSASEVPISQTSNTLVFSYSDLVPLQKKQILVNMMTVAPPTVSGGDVLNFIVIATPAIVDQFPEDNTCVRSQVVVNSYDPNDKLVAQGEEIFIDDIDEYLIYTIRFQNTGTASAINVRVTDELSQNLDWNTLTPVDSSHEYNAQLTNGNNLEILFEDIYLTAQQDDEQASNGYFIFKIKPKSDLVVGDVIHGEAQIYFDFNPPIITDTIATEIVEDQLSVSEFESNVFSVFPNPTSFKLNIQSKIGISEISIVDINGRILNTADNLDLSLDVELDVENLSNGIYFLRIQAENNEHTVRFIKN